MPIVSIVVPVYKVESYLRQCVDSILAQTYKNFELILVDDGSPDNCGAICDEYAAKDCRIRVIHQENGGLSAARNAGLDIAVGDYVAFVDSDDWIAQDMIEKLYNGCCTENADIAVCDVAVYIPQEGVRYHESPMKDECFTQDVLVQKMIEPHAWHYIIVCNKLFRRDLFAKVRFPDGFIHEDAAVAHRIAGECKKVVSIAQELYYYRQNPESITGSPYSIRRTDNLSALADRIRYAYQRRWKNMWNHTASRYAYSFFDVYMKIPYTPENQMYINRINQSLRIALPYLMCSGAVSMRHKLHLILIRINPGLYRWLKHKSSQMMDSKRRKGTDQ